MLDLFEDWELPNGNRFILLGSCFSDNLAPYLKETNYHVCSNPFGTLFHPIPILNWIDLALSEEVNEGKFQLVFHENQWKSLCGGKEFRDESKEKLLARVHSKLHEFREELKEANALVITLGTAHAWLHEEFGIVGNCQRLPNSKFIRRIIPLEMMVEHVEGVLRKLNSINPFLRVVFTVSPVKHWRMGIAENARTKARCIELVYALRIRCLVSYFPSYEFVTDVLRNDEYFESDRCHPNEKAIQLVAEKFIGYSE